MATTTITLDDAVKQETTEILDTLGLSLSGYFNLAARQLIIKRRIPFDIEAPDPAPNEATRRAMVAAEARELGIIPDDTPAFTDVDDASRNVPASPACQSGRKLQRAHGVPSRRRHG